MATLYEIGQALRNADAAGDVEAAKRLAQAYRELQTGSARREEAEPEPEKLKHTLAGTVQDIGATTMKGIVGLGESLVGLADIPSQGGAGQALEEAGYKPEEIQQYLESQFSPATQAARRKTAEAKGFLESAKAYLQNPSAALTTAGESVPQMLGGYGVAKTALGIVPKLGGALAAGIGEGAMGGGAAAEKLRQEAPEGKLTGKDLGAVAGTMLTTGAFGALSGAVARRFGFTDPDTMFLNMGTEKPAGFLRNIAEAGISEGALEEMPQSAFEQMWQNYAQNKPLLEGVPEQAGAGLVLGGAMGAAGAGLHAGIGGYNNTIAPPARQPEQEAPVEEPVVSPLAREEAAQEAIVPPSEFQMRHENELEQVQKDIRDLKQANEEQQPEIVQQNEDIGTAAAAATPEVEKPAAEEPATEVNKTPEPEKTVTPEPVTPEISQAHIDIASKVAEQLRKKVDTGGVFTTVPGPLRAAAKNLGVYDKTHSPTDMLNAVETKLSEIKQGAPNATTETTESGGPAASPTGAMGSNGVGAGVGDTTKSTVADGASVEPAGSNVSDAVRRTGEPDAALVSEDYRAELDKRFNGYAKGLASTHKVAPETLNGESALNNRYIASLYDDLGNALTLRDTQQEALATEPDSKAKAKDSQAAIDKVNEVVSALHEMGQDVKTLAPLLQTTNKKGRDALLGALATQHTEQSMQDNVALGVKLNEQKRAATAKSDYTQMLDAFVKGSNTSASPEEIATAKQEKQDLLNKKVEKTSEGALKSYSDEDLRRLRGLKQFTLKTLPDTANESYADSVASSLRRVEREIARRAGTLGAAEAYSLPIGKERGVPLQGAAATHIGNGNVQGAVNTLAAAHKDPQIRALMHRVGNLLGNTKVRIGDPTDTEAGSYDAATDTITLHPTHGMKEHVLMHEAVHAAVSKVLSNPHDPKTVQFNKFFATIQNQLGTEYGGTSLQEFTSELLSNPDFQALVNNIKAPKSKSMLHRIFEAITEMLGFRKGTTAFDKALKHINDVLNLAEYGSEVGAIEEASFGTAQIAQKGLDQMAEALREVHKIPKAVRENAFDSASNLKGKALDSFVDLMSLYNLADMMDKRLSGSSALAEDSKHMANMIHALHKLIGQRDKDLKIGADKDSKIEVAARRAQAKDPKGFARVFDLARQAEELGVDPLRPADYKIGTRTPNASNPAAYAKIKAAMLNRNQISQESFDAYKAMRDAYDKSFSDFVSIVREMIGDKYADQIAAKQLVAYMPRNRYGEHVVEYTDPDSNERTVRQFESIAERERFIKDVLVPNDIEFLQHRRINDWHYSRAAVPQGQSLRKLMDTVEQTGATPEQMDDIYQMYLQFIPADSFAKKFMHRKNIAGASEDPIRDFANTSMQWNSKLNRSVYGPKLDDALEAVVNAGRRKDDPMLQSVARSVSERADFIRNPIHKGWANKAAAVSYGMFIAGNLSSAFVNMSALGTMIWPHLGAKHGFDKALNAMNACKGEAIGNWGAIPKYRKLYHEMVQNDQLTNSMDRDIINARNVASKHNTGLGNAVMNMLSLPFTESEKYIRSVTAISAYNLAKSKGMSDEAAIQDAVNTVIAMNTSGSASSGPQMFQSDLGKVFFTFKSFAFNAAYVTGRAFVLAARQAKNIQRDPNESDEAFQARKSEVVEASRIARRQLIAMYGMAGALGGIKGLPFYGAATTMWAVLNSLAGDDDDKPFEPEKELQDAFGDILTGGLVNGLTNLQIGQRTALFNDLIWRDNPRMVQEHGYVLTGMASAFGPAGQYLMNWGNAADMARQGHYERAVETVMPSAARNVMKGVRLMSEGAKTLKGDSIQTDVSAWNGAMQMIGFAPADLSEIQDRNAMAMRYQKSVRDKHDQLLTKINMAHQADDQEMMQEAISDIAEYNQREGVKPIKPADIQRSIKLRARNNALAVHGMVFDKALRNKIIDEFYSDIDEDEED